MNKLNPKKALSSIGHAPLKLAKGAVDVTENVAKGALDVGQSAGKGVLDIGEGAAKGVMAVGDAALSGPERLARQFASADTSQVDKIQTSKKQDFQIEAHADPDLIESAPKELSSAFKYVWGAGHLLTVALSLTYFALWLYSVGRWRSCCQRTIAIVYRLLFLTIVGTYALSYKKRFGSRSPDIYGLLRFTTVQYGLLAVLWLFTHQHILKIVPYAIYASLQGSSFLLSLLKNNDAGLAAQLDTLGNQGLQIIAISNIALYLRLVLDAFTMKSDALPSILIYSFFYRLRVEYGPGNGELWNKLLDTADGYIDKPSASPKVKRYWKNFKWQLENHENHELSPVHHDIFKHSKK